MKREIPEAPSCWQQQQGPSDDDGLQKAPEQISSNNQGKPMKLFKNTHTHTKVNTPRYDYKNKNLVFWCLTNTLKTSVSSTYDIPIRYSTPTSNAARFSGAVSSTRMWTCTYKF